MARTDWVDVDLDGLAKTLERDGVGWVMRELLQNALDEDGVTRVDVSFERGGRGRWWVHVQDDSPAGFADLADSWTLYGESRKKGDVRKAGRFMAGEKYVLAMCLQAQVASTKGTVTFGVNGRDYARHAARASGTRFSGLMVLDAAGLDEMRLQARTVLVPPSVTLTVDGSPVPPRQPVHSFRALLETECADAHGVLRRRKELADVRLYEPLPGERARLYELGLPVVETGDRWHVDVRQKVPLTMDRENVRPSFLQAVRVAVLNEAFDRLDSATANQTWVRDAAASRDALDDAVRTVVSKRFGDKVTSYDPSDPEANKLATARGYVVVHGGSMSAGEWERAREVGAIRPSGQVTPSPKPFSADGTPLQVVPRDEWPSAWRAFEAYARKVALATCGIERLNVVIANDRGWPLAAAYRKDDATLYLNAAKEGREFFAAGPTVNVNSLLIHELAHHYSGDHLSSEYFHALSDVGAKLVRAALDHPEMFLSPKEGQ
jgi:hypothetical protein